MTDVRGERQTAATRLECPFAGEAEREREREREREEREREREREEREREGGRNTDRGRDVRLVCRNVSFS